MPSDGRWGSPGRGRCAGLSPGGLGPRRPRLRHSCHEAPAGQGWGTWARPCLRAFTCGLSGEGLRVSPRSPRRFAWLVPRLTTSWGRKPATWPAVSAVTWTDVVAMGPLGTQPSCTALGSVRGCGLNTSGARWSRRDERACGGRARGPHPEVCRTRLSRLSRRWVSAPPGTPPAKSHALSALPAGCPPPLPHPQGQQWQRTARLPARRPRPILHTGQRRPMTVRRRRRSPDPMEGTSTEEHKATWNILKTVKRVFV